MGETPTIARFMNPSESSYIPPSGYDCIKVVGSFEELVNTPFSGAVNALCWPRTLPGDFSEIVTAIATQFGEIEEITTLDEESLLALRLSPAGKVARDILINDQRLLRDAGLDPILDCIPAYPKDPDAGPVPTDVYGFHADSATVLADTFLCSYTVAASEGLRNEDVVARVEISAVRAELLKIYGGPDDAAFLVYLNENCFDLHYLPKGNAVPFNFGLGNLWRISTQCPGSPVPPCVHRAPTTREGQPPRLLLIS